MGKAGNWFWAVPTARAKAVLELFLKLAVVRGQHYGEVLEEVLHKYNQEFLFKRGLNDTVLVEEAQMLEALRQQETEVSRRTLWKHRTTGHLTDGNRPLFYAHGNKVVYDLARVKAFYKETRAEA